MLHVAGYVRCRASKQFLRRIAAAARTDAASTSSSSPTELVITRPDDWHLHVRDGAGLQSVVPHTAKVFGRAVIMPNLVPPVTTAALVRHLILCLICILMYIPLTELYFYLLVIHKQAVQYRQRIEAAVPSGSTFHPLMTIYLTDNTTPEDVVAAKEAGAVAFKLYPAGATTNSDSGVTDWKKCLTTLKTIQQVSE